MPKDLAALLVEEGAASAEAVARALDRQRENGGALDTALLEEGVLREGELVPWLARAAELPEAPATAWEAADARARRVFPSRVAERHGLAPFALEGRELSLVATFPVDLALLDEISFMLSLDLTAHVGPEWRVRELIHRLYGAPLAPRFAALAAAAGAPGVAAAAPVAEPPAGAGGGEPIPPRAEPTGFAREGSEPLEPLAAALQQALEDPSFLDDEAPPGETSPPGDAAAADDGEEPEPERPPQDRTAPPRWSYDDARAALAAARHRDDVVLAAIRYARDFFEYAAVFAVTRDAVAGHDALGDHDERDRAHAVAIWASDAGIFKTVIETRAPYLGPVSRDAAGNEAILSGLGRGTPRTAFLYPVLLRDRPICVVYADNGEAPVSPRRLGDLSLLLSRVGPAFERIIQDRKRRRRPRRTAPRAQPPAAAEPAGAPPADVPPPEPAQVAAPAAAPEPRARSASAEPGEASVTVRRAAETVPDAGAPPAGAGADLPPAPSEPALAAAAPSPPSEVAAPPARGPGDEPPLEAAARSLPPAAEPGPARGAATRAEPPVLIRAPAPGADPLPAAPATPQDLEPLPVGVLADRALDADAQVAAAACDALARRRREPELRSANEKLRRALLSGLSGKAARAARAIGAVRDVEAIPLLIQVLETSEPETARASADALAAITLQRLGTDARKWLGWWKENRGRGRAEWLFSGLTSPDRETRVTASVELSLAAPPPVAYSADLPPAEREKTARAWAGWWARSGHVL